MGLAEEHAGCGSNAPTWMSWTWRRCCNHARLRVRGCICVRLYPDNLSRTPSAPLLWKGCNGILTVVRILFTQGSCVLSRTNDAGLAPIDTQALDVMPLMRKVVRADSVAQRFGRCTGTRPDGDVRCAAIAMPSDEHLRETS